MKVELELRPDETFLEEVKGDYWSGWFIFSTQNHGIYTLTNQRVVFTPRTLISTGSNFEFDYSEIESIRKCFIGPFLPFGIRVATKKGKKYTLSLMKRNKWIAFMESKR